MTIGERLKSLRELKGLSQNELARRAGINRPTISELESGRQQDVTVETARRLARALEVSLNMLVGEDEEETQAADEALVGARDLAGSSVL